ncbi:unnamed protein product [Hermetia illucens]|uniref:Uncharacterized protein n=1 Tax=Hermetia illucens TaxID=343691 RepID=A0A7R8UU06_HERIL|nr:uncharacterized protein LOC119651043 [Hermetia illucens]XP_037910292.1 uncharacterized protein LOC119651043 [Hermetia illucens]XP_037910293.1 uncharacterized protein LOC119651043 [Hermetia illucens]CAD7085913.1 unnamed protein product [Hermetia illucens]
MSLTLEPDYFISSDGLPKLNTKKYKRYDKKSYRSKVENLEQVSTQDKVTEEQAKRLFTAESKPFCDSKKLLTKRPNMKTSSKNHTTNNALYHLNDKKSIMSDKELKCAINQKIKLCQNSRYGTRKENSNKSNEMLDNRLATYQENYCNGVLIDLETDAIVLDF